MNRRVAIHEAGHAVAAMVLVGRNPFPVSIVPDDRTNGRARAGNIVVPGFHYPKPWVEAEVLVLLAGLAAEEVIGGDFDAIGSALDCWEEDEGYDIFKAMTWLAASSVASDTHEHRLAVLYRRALRLLGRAEVRSAVAVLVERLLEVQVVDCADQVADRMAALVEPWARRPWLRCRGYSASSSRSAR